MQTERPMSAIVGSLRVPEYSTQTKPRPPIVHRLPSKYLSNIESGVKTVDVRRLSGWHCSIQKGDDIIFYAGNRKVKCLVLDAIQYPTIARMLEKEGVSNCFPGITEVEKGVQTFEALTAGYKKTAEKVLAIRLRLYPKTSNYPSLTHS